MVWVGVRRGGTGREGGVRGLDFVMAIVRLC
jgi:hypothetical protein